jgi:hypothetical protein
MDLPEPTKPSVAEKFNAMSPGARIAIYACSAVAGAILLGAIGFCCIKKRKQGRREAEAYRARQEAMDEEDRRWKASGLDADKLVGGAVPLETMNSKFTSEGASGFGTSRGSIVPPLPVARMDSFNEKGPVQIGVQRVNSDAATARVMSPVHSVHPQQGFLGNAGPDRNMMASPVYSLSNGQQGWNGQNQHQAQVSPSWQAGLPNGGWGANAPRMASPVQQGGMGAGYGNMNQQVHSQPQNFYAPQPRSPAGYGNVNSGWGGGSAF